MNTWSIAVTSDLHYGRPEVRRYKDYQLEKIKSLKNEKNIEMTINAGDLTNQGKKEELDLLKNEWIKPLEEEEIKVLLTIGNHDRGKSKFCRPLFDYIKNRHNATKFCCPFGDYSGCYTCKHNGILFISCGIYPKNRCWLKNKLKKGQPTIIFYHYNTREEEKFSNWWSSKSKRKFHDIVKDYKNEILCIINGHIHSSYDREWNGFRMINGGSGSMPLITIEDKKIKSLEFIKN